MKNLNLLLIAVVMLPISIFANESITVKALVDSETGIVGKGRPIRFSGYAEQNGNFVPGLKMKYVLKVDGNVTDEKEFISSESPEKVYCKLDYPGWIKIEFLLLSETDKTGNGQKKIAAEVGALVAPDEIRICEDEPPDFEAFWRGVKAELAEVPMRVLESVEVDVPESRKNVRCFDVKISCAGGMPVSGYLSMPSGNIKPKSLPAIINFQGAGVWTSNKNLDGADKVIRMEINAHGIENGKPRDYYDSLGLGNYMWRGKTDPNEMYYKGVIMRLLRALEYLKSLPEWNGKSLVVTGFSQGGAQAIWAAGLDKDVSLCIATCPALCDLSATKANPPRLSGWPSYFDWNSSATDKEKVANAVRYYDCAFFARRMKADAYFATGLADRTCVPTSVFAAYNEIPKNRRKSMQTVPNAGHNGSINKIGSDRVNFVITTGRKK